MTQANEFLSGLSKENLQKIRDRIRATKINVLLVGGTGVGKSSTISALFQNYGLESRATIGQTTKPETMDVSAHELDNLVIWDTPGLGDSPEKDAAHRSKIIELLRRKDSQGQPLIDLVFLALDAGSRDLSSAFTLINEVVLPELHHDDRDRLLIGINQADMALKGRFWSVAENKPEPELLARLDDLVQTIRDRIKKDTGLDVEPIYYSAGYVVDGKVLTRPYNLQKLLSFILDRLPNKKRAAIASYINEDEENFRSNDGKENYQEKVKESIFSSFMGYVKDVLGEVGGTVGGIVKKIVTDPENIKWLATAALSSLVALLRKK